MGGGGKGRKVVPKMGGGPRHGLDNPRRRFSGCVLSKKRKDKEYCTTCLGSDTVRCVV